MILLGLPFYKYDSDKFTIGNEFSYQLQDKSIEPIRLSKVEYENRAYWTTYFKADQPILRVWGGSSNQKRYLVDFTLVRVENKLTDNSSDTYESLRVICDVAAKSLSETLENGKSLQPWLAPMENMASPQENIAFAKTIYLDKLDQYKYVLLTDKEKALWL